MFRVERRLTLGLAGCALLFACSGTEDAHGAGGDTPLSDAGIADGAAPSGDAGFSDAPTGCEAADCGFERVDGLDDGGVTRRVGDEFYTLPEALFANAGDSKGWVFWRSYTTPDFTEQTTHLDRFDARGVFDRSSALAASRPDGIVVHADGTLTSYRNRCGERQADTCFAHDALTGAAISEGEWPVSSRLVTRYRLDEAGNVVGTIEQTFDARHLFSAAGDRNGLYALTSQGTFVVTRLGHTHERPVETLLPSARVK
jgi:hypothetical protein